MKLRTIVKIAVTSSVVLLCTGFVLYSFFRLSSVENHKDFNLYDLVPSSASAILATDDAAGLITEIDELTCSKNQHYLHCSKLFSYLKQYLYTVLEEAPHGLSRQMNQILISFHEPDNDRNQILYCSLGVGDHDFIEKFVRKYISSDYPSKTFNYKGENINIYPLVDGDFLACYLTQDFMILSYQKKLIEEVIDARKLGKTLATDSTFSVINKSKKSASVATIYSRLDGLIGWTEFDMKFKDDFIYSSGISRNANACPTFADTFSRHKPMEGFSGDILPATSFYFTRRDIGSWSSEIQEADKQLARYLVENTERDLITCLFQRKDTLNKTAAMMMSLSVADVQGAERILRSFADSSPSLCYTPQKAYAVYTLPHTKLFTQLTNLVGHTSCFYATFHEGHLLMTPDVEGLLDYIRQLEVGEVLDETLAYQAGVNGLSDSYHFILMADFEQVFSNPENYDYLLPDFFFRNADFFQNFVLFVQFTCTDGLVHSNIILRYKSEINDLSI